MKSMRVRVFSAGRRHHWGTERIWQWRCQWCRKQVRCVNQSACSLSTVHQDAWQHAWSCFGQTQWQANELLSRGFVKGIEAWEAEARAAGERLGEAARDGIEERKRDEGGEQ